MQTLKEMVTLSALKEGLKYLEHNNSQENLMKLLHVAEKIVVDPGHLTMVEGIKKGIMDEDSMIYRYLQRHLLELTHDSREKLITSFIGRGFLLGRPKSEEMSRKYGCSIPWSILLDPTSACNLNCIGCWAAEYSKNTAIRYERIDRLVEEGKELGIYTFIYSGGEPLTRKKELIKLAEKHQDCYFLAFTNGTLVDKEFAKALARVGNFSLAFSIEGFEEETDARRGKGSFESYMRAMDLLKEEGVLFGFSTCYHSKNYEIVGSDEYLNMLMEKGCLYGWYFTYMPLGKDANLDLICTPEQRESMYHKLRKSREHRPLFLLDFWNDGEYINGCIAGGRKYFHINSAGDVEPCAFIHYSNVNINEVSLIDALQCDLFKEYQNAQPFNENLLMPCPLLDNPQQIRKMVQRSGAHSTQPLDLEDVEDLAAKCDPIAAQWEVTARRLWQEGSKVENDRILKAK